MRYSREVASEFEEMARPLDRQISPPGGEILRGEFIFSLK
jgi:hypothetical protein